MTKKGGVEFANFSSQWEARACCPDQYKHENEDQIHVIKRSRVCINWKKIRIFFFKANQI
jgi:hypothetical protein